MRFLCALATFILLSLASEPILAAGRLTLLDSLPEPDASSNPANFKRVGNLLFFNANGTDIWVTDGTAAGTRKTTFTGTIDNSYYASDTALYRYKVSSEYAMPSLVEYKDGPEGPLQATLIEIQCDTTPNSKTIVEYKGEIYFAAKVGAAMGYPESGIELVACKRGEPDTFRRVTDIYEGVGSSSPRSLTVCNGLLFFTADKYIYLGPFPDQFEIRRPLFSFDGTSLNLAGDFKSIYGLICAENILYLFASNSSTDYRIWYRDPDTQINSQMATYTSSPPEMKTFGKYLFFVQSSREIWMSNASFTGFTKVWGTEPDSEYKSIKGPYINGNRAFFVVVPSNPYSGSKFQVWRLNLDGSTVLLKTFSDMTLDEPVGATTDYFHFGARSVSGDVTLWKSDGTPEGTISFTSLGNSISWSDRLVPRTLGILSNRFIFMKKTLLYGEEPHVTDGTAAGTHLLANISTTSTITYMNPVGVLDEKLFYRRTEEQPGTGWWPLPPVTSLAYLTMPTKSTTIDRFSEQYTEEWSRVTSTFSHNGFFKRFLTKDNIYFPVDQSVYTVDNSAMSMNYVFDGVRYNAHYPIDCIDEKIYGYAHSYISSESYGPARINGVAGQTNYYRQYLPAGSQFSSAFSFVGIIGNNAYFPVTTDEAGSELWKSDATASGTKRVMDINPGAASSNPRNGRMCGNLLYFCATTVNEGSELWRSNGSEAGTKLVEDIVPGTGSSTPMCLGPAGDIMILSANDGTHGAELWRSNGNAAGTYLLKDTRPSADGQTFQYMGANKGFAYIASQFYQHDEVWRTDGSVAGTVRIAEFPKGTDFCRYYGKLGDYFFFTNPSGKLCATNGDGYALISEATSEGFFSDKYFYQCTGQSEHGTTFLRSDGTAEGTQPFTAPSSGSSPVLLGILDGHLIYSLRDDATNVQNFWAFDVREDAAVQEWWRIYK